MQKYSLMSGETTRLKLIARYASAAILFLSCAVAGMSAARAGISRLLSEYGAAVGSLAATARAVDWNDADPEAHYAHALQLADANQNDEAVAEFERAVSLGPGDYLFWQGLGQARENGEDIEGAVAALRRAIELAPDYAEPHWQLGNLLLRRNELDPAFAEMRAAVRSDAERFAVMADLAWRIYDGDPKSVLAATQPQTDDERISLARFLIAGKQPAAGLNLLGTIPKITAADRRALVAALIAAREFEAAHRVWIKGVNSGDMIENDLFDGGFEGSMNSDDGGFGWLPAHAQTIRVQLDPNEPQSGQRSLGLEYSGGFDPAVPAISQLTLVAPHTRYRLRFFARTEGLSSGGLPAVAIRAAIDGAPMIAQSVALASGTNGWHDYSIEFETNAANSVIVSIQRQPCLSNPCPIVGRAWFDSFILKRL